MSSNFEKKVSNIMKSTINQKIKIIIDERFNGNISEFARAIDEQSQTISKYYNDKSIPGGEIIEKIFSKLKNINPAWFFRNEGDMLLKKVYIEDVIEKLSDRVRRIEDLLDDDDLIPPEKTPKAPIQDLRKEKINKQ